MRFQMTFPTAIHEAAAQTIVGFWREHPQTAAVLLTNSCARGVAIAESDLDMNVLIAPAIAPAEIAGLEAQWRTFLATQPIFAQLKQNGPFAGVHLDCFKDDWRPEIWDDGGGPDDFELNIGNAVAYSALLWQRDAAFKQMQARWLPYYAEPLRRERLAMVRSACAYDLDYVAFFVRRGLYFQAFDRLYKAFREFLQALFIAQRTYPIAYNKWIHQQIVDILGLPELYPQLAPILQIKRLESAEISENAAGLRRLLDTWVRD